MLAKECTYVWKIYEERSFSRAAEKLYLTQPALSIAVKRFEERLGVTLFDRSSAPLQLTPEGECFIETMQKMNALQQEMRDYFDAQNASRTGCIDIISNGDYFSCALPQIIDSFREKFPGYEIKPHNVDTKEFRECLDSGLIDMCFTVKSFEHPEFERLDLYTEKLLLAVPAAFPINDALVAERMTFADVANHRHNKKSCRPVSIDRIRDVPLLLLQDYNDLSQRVTKVFEAAHVSPHVVMRLDQMLTAYYVAAAGMGAAFIRSELISSVKPTDKLFFYRIADPQMERTMKLYFRRSMKKTQPYVDFLRFVSGWSEAIQAE